MLAKVEVWEVPDRLTDFETYVGLNREEVEDEGIIGRRTSE